jgi:hypothetical protein
MACVMDLINQHSLEFPPISIPLISGWTKSTTCVHFVLANNFFVVAC